MNSYLNKLKTLEERVKRVKGAKGLPIVIKPGYVINNGIKLFKTLEDVRAKYPTSLIIIDDLTD